MRTYMCAIKVAKTSKKLIFFILQAMLLFIKFRIHTLNISWFLIHFSLEICVLLLNRILLLLGNSFEAIAETPYEEQSGSARTFLDVRALEKIRKNVLFARIILFLSNLKVQKCSWLVFFVEQDELSPGSQSDFWELHFLIGFESCLIPNISPYWWSARFKVGIFSLELLGTFRVHQMFKLVKA